MFFVLFGPKKGVTASAANVQFINIGDAYYRPVCGEILINTLIHDKFEYWGIFEAEERRRTFFHEITHALAFSPTFFDHYIDEKGNKIPKEKTLVKVSNKKLGQEVPYLASPEILKLVKKYFKCPEAKGFPLAIKDSAHFNHQIVANQMMRPMSDNFVDRVSKFALKIYEDTGWYLINKSIKEKTLWGKGKGCNFLELECNDSKGKIFEEYCDLKNAVNKFGCDYYYQNISYCAKTNALKDVTCGMMTPMDKKFCLVAEANAKPSNIGEVYGKKSKCLEIFTGGKRFAGCYEAKCDMKGKKITLTVNGKSHVINYDENNKPKEEKFTMQVGSGNKTMPMAFFAPSLERFCYNIVNFMVDKNFKKKKRIKAKRTKI